MFRILPILLSAVALLAGRYYPWRRVTGRELGQAEAAAFGVAVVIAPMTLALLDTRPREVTPAECVRAYLQAGTAAGVTVLAAAALDAYAERRHQVTDEQERARIYADFRHLD